MKAVVLEEKGRISLRDFPIEEKVGPGDVKIRIKTVGICGSDVHYYTHGRIGDFIVKEPMILGHEASGVVEEVGADVEELSVGDRVCMEPGIPRYDSPESLSGRYNIDPAVRFWATPPIHGCLRETVVHPAAFTFKLPDQVSFEEGAMAEPLAIGLHAASKAEIKPGDTAVVAGCGTIGLMTALACRAGGCGRVFVTDIDETKLALAREIPGVTAIDASQEDAAARVRDLTQGRGANLFFEATGAPAVARTMFSYLAPGGTVVAIGMPPEGTLPIDIVAAQAKEITIRTIFRYVNIYPRALELLAAGSVNLRPFINRKFPLSEAVEAFDYVASAPKGLVKAVIEL